MEEYQTLVSQASYGSVGLSTAIVGFVLLMYFFMYATWHCRYQITNKTKHRSLNFEILLALLASAFCSVGLFGLGLSVGLYFWCVALYQFHMECNLDAVRFEHAVIGKIHTQAIVVKNVTGE